jgi:hypothetical protein
MGGDIASILFLQPCLASGCLAFAALLAVLTLLFLTWMLQGVWVVHQRRRRRRYALLLQGIPRSWKADYDATPVWVATAREFGFDRDQRQPDVDWCELPWWPDIGEAVRIGRHRGPDEVSPRRRWWS